MNKTQTANNLATTALFAQAKRHEDRTALLVDGQAFSYREVADIATGYARQLAALDIRPGERVLMAMPDSIGFVGAFFGIMSVGAVAVPAAPGLSQQAAQHIIDKTDCKLALAATSASLEALENCQLLFIDCQSRTPFLDQTTDAPFEVVERTGDDLAYILFSSGSTGAAKGIPHRHIDLLHCAAAYADPVVKYQSDDIVLCVPKLSFGYALGCNLVFPLLSGAASILIEPVPTQEVLEQTARLQPPTIFIGQPRNLVAMLESGPDGPFNKLRLAVVAGEKLSPTLAQRWQEVFPGVPLLDGYGTTEANAIFISNTPDASKLGSLGKPLSGYQVQLLGGPELTPVEEGETGELWFKGDSVCREYWQDPIATAERIRDGWVRTGDLFTRDQDGYYFLQGRRDDLLKVGCGDWVNPLSVEAEIQKVDKVAESVVVGHPDSDGVIQLKAFILLVEGTRPTRRIRDEILITVSQAFEQTPSHHIQQIEFVSSLPRTATGKLHRQKLKSHTQLEFAYQC